MSSEFMRRAIAVAQDGMRRKVGGPFGAVVVKDNIVLGEGSNSVTSTNDPTAHAEIVAIRRACERVGDFSLKGTTLYTTCEPCPMCYAAIHWARVDKVIYASDRHGAARAGFDDQMLWDDIGAPQNSKQLSLHHAPSAEADALFEAWLAMTDKTPY